MLGSIASGVSNAIRFGLHDKRHVGAGAATQLAVAAGVGREGGVALAEMVRVANVLVSLGLADNGRDEAGAMASVALPPSSYRAFSRCR